MADVVNTSYYGVDPVRERLKTTFADGSKFDRNSLSVASWDYPLGTQLRITDPKTGIVGVGVVRDRGPNKRLLKDSRDKKGRLIKGRRLDMTVGMWDALGLDRKKGISSVLIEPIVPEQNVYQNALGGQ